MTIYKCLETADVFPKRQVVTTGCSTHCSSEKGYAVCADMRIRILTVVAPMHAWKSVQDVPAAGRSPRSLAGHILLTPEMDPGRNLLFPRYTCSDWKAIHQSLGLGFWEYVHTSTMTSSAASEMAKPMLRPFSRCAIVAA